MRVEEILAKYQYELSIPDIIIENIICNAWKIPIQSFVICVSSKASNVVFF